MLDDGQYYIQYSGELVDGSKQTQKVPVMLDNTEPEFGTHAYDFDSKIFSVRGTDALSGVAEYLLLEVALTEEGPSIKGLIEANESGDFDLKALGVDPLFVTYAISDYAGNLAMNPKLIQLMDGQVPDVKLNVEPFEVQTENKFDLVGTVSDMLPDVEVKVDGELVEVVDVDGVSTFTKEMNYEEDGKKGIRIDAVDLVGNEVTFTRWFYIDSTPATLELINEGEAFSKDELNYISYDSSSLEAIIRAGDNFPYLKVKVNNSEVFYYEDDFIAYEEKLVAVEREIPQKLQLEPGMNTYIVDVYDAAGTITSAKYQLYLLDEDATEPVVKSISISGPDTITNEFYEGSKTQYRVEVLDMNDGKLPYEDQVIWSYEIDGIEGTNVIDVENGQVIIDPYEIETTSEITIKASLGDHVASKTVEVNVPSYQMGFGLVGMNDFDYDSESETFIANLGLNTGLDKEIKAFILDQYDNELDVEYELDFELIENKVNAEKEYVTFENNTLKISQNFEGSFKITIVIEDDVIDFVYQVTRPSYLNSIEVEGNTSIQALSSGNVKETYVAKPLINMDKL